MYADGAVYEPVSKKEYAELAAREAKKVLDAAVKRVQSAGVECGS